MKYLLLIYENEAGFGNLKEAERGQEELEVRVQQQQRQEEPMKMKGPPMSRSFF